MTLQAQTVSSLRIKTVTANYCTLQWNSLGSSYTYKVQRKLSSSGDDAWETISPLHYQFSVFYDTDLSANTEYDYAIISRQKGVVDSDRAIISTKTFATNSYNLYTANNVRLYDEYVQNRFSSSIVDNPDNLKIKETDVAQLMLMRADYKYDSSHEFGDLEPYILNARSNLAVYGKTPNGCGGFGCSIPALYLDYVLVFDRKQKVVRYSNDKGKSWRAKYALPDLTGNPYHQSLTSNNKLGLFVMGYNSIMLAHEDVDIYWSDTNYHLSDDETRFDSIVESRRVNADFVFEHFVNLPPGVMSGTLDAIASDDNYLYVAVRNHVYRCDLVTREWDSNIALLISVYGPTADDRIKDMVIYRGLLFAYQATTVDGAISLTAGIYVVNWDIIDYPYTFRIFGNTSDELDAISPEFSSLSRDDDRLFLGIKPGPYSITESEVNGSVSYEFTRLIYNPQTGFPIEQAQSSSNSRPFREILSIYIDGVDVIFSIHKELWQYEEHYIYTGLPDSNVIDPDYSAARIRINDTNLISVITARQQFTQRVMLTDSYSKESTTISILPSSSSFFGFPGAVSGVLLCLIRDDNYYPLAYNSLPLNYRNTITFSWLAPDIVVKASLQKYASPPSAIDDYTGLPSLTPFAETFVPEHYSYREPKFVDFVREYLKYISTGGFSNYGQLKYLRHMHDANEKQIYIDMFETDITRRNIYVDEQKRREINKFMYNRARDLYSIKGTVDSYKFLFRLLYGEDVEVRVENSYEFLLSTDVIVTHVNGISTEGYTSEQTVALMQLLSGQKIHQSDVRDDLNITKIDVSDIPTYGEIISAKVKSTSLQYPKFLINVVNLHGSLELNKTYTIDVNDETQILVKIASDTIVVPNSNRANYGSQQRFILRLESGLPMSRYRSDVINFVHPVGFDFLGAYLISTFVYTGLPDYHIETIIEYKDAIRWDNGIPARKQYFHPDLNVNGEYQYSTNWYMLPNGQMSKLLKVTPIDPELDVDVDALSIDPNYYTNNSADLYGQGPGVVYGLSIDERRSLLSPLFDSSACRFVDMINNPDVNNAYTYDQNNDNGFDESTYIGNGNYLVSLRRTRHDHDRLKDNVLTPLDPNATQRKHLGGN